MGILVPWRTKWVQSGAGPAARAGNRAAPSHGISCCRQAGVAAWRSRAGGLRLSVAGTKWRGGGRPLFGVVRFRHGLARDLQHDVPAAQDDDRLGPRGGQTALLPLAESPCPSCTAFLDQLDGAAEHVSQRVNLAVVGKAPIGRIMAFAEERGWRRLRLLSSAGNTYNRDYWAETGEGDQQPMLNVFHRDGPIIRHFWGSELFYAPRIRSRTRATLAPSSRCGTSSTSLPKAGGPTGSSR